MLCVTCITEPAVVPLVHMFLGSLLTWWYGLGWARLMQKVLGRIHGVLDFFSVGTVLRTLFAPFRQISASRVHGTVQDQLAAFGDRVFSRFMGAVIRLMLVFAGLICALVISIFGAILILAWPILPVLPLVGIVLMQAGVAGK